MIHRRVPFTFGACHAYVDVAVGPSCCVVFRMLGRTSVEQQFWNWWGRRHEWEWSQFVEFEQQWQCGGRRRSVEFFECVKLER